MLTGKQQQNKLLISITDGKKLGEIKDLYLDSELKTVAAVLLGKEGFVRRKSIVIDRKAIQILGVDAWLTGGGACISEFEELPEADSLVLLSELKGREIQTEGGTKIGTVEDIVFDETAHVLGFVLGKVYVQGPLSERQTITRAAITSVGGKDVPMTTILARAEESNIPDSPPIQSQPVVEQSQG